MPDWQFWGGEVVSNVRPVFSPPLYSTSFSDW